MVYFCQTAATAMGMPKWFSQFEVQVPPNFTSCVSEVRTLRRATRDAAALAQKVIPENAEAS